VDQAIYQPVNRYNALYDTRQFRLDLWRAGEGAVPPEVRDRAASLLKPTRPMTRCVSSTRLALKSSAANFDFKAVRGLPAMGNPEPAQVLSTFERVRAPLSAQLCTSHLLEE